MTKRVERFLYGLGFAIINWAEATVALLTLGLYHPGWTMSYCATYTKWWIQRKINNHERG